MFFSLGVGTPMGLRNLSFGVAAIYGNKKGTRVLHHQVKGGASDVLLQVPGDCVPGS